MTQLSASRKEAGRGGRVREDRASIEGKRRKKTTVVGSIDTHHNYAVLRPECIECFCNSLGTTCVDVIN